MTDVFRFYLMAQQDGYPPEWSRLPGLAHGIKDIVREEAGHRCVRCGHPYTKGMGEWSPCDTHCTHDGPIRWYELSSYDQTWKYQDLKGTPAGDGIVDRGASGEPIERYRVDAQWRILTVHHLNGVKLDCRWWNLASLCQRCHLVIQGKVRLERSFIREHTDWFKPYAAGWYAHKYLGEDLTREETMARLDELLAFEFTEEALF